MGTYYYYAPDRIGPVDAGRIRQLAASGVITRETIIEDQGGRRYYARQIPGLFAEEVPVPPPAPPAATDNTSTGGLDPTKIYYYDANNNPVGPVTGEELRSLLFYKKINNKTKICFNGKTCSVSEIKSLRLPSNFDYTVYFFRFVVIAGIIGLYCYHNPGSIFLCLFLAFPVFVVVVLIKILGNQQALIDQNKKR